MLADQNRVDGIVHYRNLAISLGAKPTDMVNAFDRQLCEDGVTGERDGHGWWNDAPDTWDELEAAEANAQRIDQRASEIEGELHDERARGDAAVALLREAVEAFVIRHVDDWEAKVLPETLDKWRAFLETEKP